jgi:SAM-dependent methyltransferase
MSTGEEDVDATTPLESDRRARRAFRDLALRIAAPGGCIFDFGAGCGSDAKFYAARGFKVIAYDVDPRICASFARRCRPEIESGQIHLCQSGYREFVDVHVPNLRRQHEIAVVTANFAPLSLIDDPHELFATLHALTSPKAELLASVLNPYFVGDMRYGWWWSNRLQYWRQGHFCVAGAATNIFRRSLRDFALLAAPHFTLERAIRGLPGAAVAQLRSSRGPALATSRYLFLLFSKRARHASAHP